MRSAFCIAVFLLFSPGIGFARGYETGTLVRVNSSQDAESISYDLHIQSGDRSYTAHLATVSSYRLEWRVNCPIEFRLGKNAIYLRLASGRELKAPIQTSVRTAEPAPPMPDLPFPSVERPPIPIRQTESGTPMDSATPTLPHCDEIAAMGAPFGPLASACRFALSPYSLPNYLCHETTQRWVNGRERDVVAADAAYRRGAGDRYSHVTLDGKPVPSIEDTGGMITGQLFGR